MKRRASHGMTTVLVMAFLVVAGSGVTAPRAQTPDSITMGAVISLSGRDSVFGKECLDGLKLAIEEANADAYNRPLRLRVYDDQSDPIQAGEGVRSLVRRYSPLAIIGSNTSMVTSAAAVASQAAGVPLVVPEATNPAITSIGDWVFRVCFVDPDMAGALATFAYKSLGLRKVAILLEARHDYTLSLARSFDKWFRNLGGDIVVQASYAAGQTDFGDLVRSTAEKKPDAIFVSGFYPEAAAILKTAQKQKLDVAFLGGDAWEDQEFFDLADGALTARSRVYVASHFSPDLKRIKVKGFVAAFQERYDHRPNTSAALGYDAAGVVIDAIHGSKSLTPEGVRESLFNVHHEGVTGRIDIDSTRNSPKRVIIMRAGPDRRFSFVESVSCAKDQPIKEEDLHP